MTGSINHADSNAAAPFMPFGRTARNLFYFDKHFTNLNHGEYPLSIIFTPEVVCGRFFWFNPYICRRGL